MRVAFVWGLALTFVISCSPSSPDVRVYTTTSNRQWLLHEWQPEEVSDAPDSNRIIIDTTKRYQSTDGFGFTLTGGSARLIHELDSAPRAALLRELFTRAGNGIAISYLRISIGASDLDDAVFSYCDLPAGQTDPTLARFNLSRDTLHLIPLLKEIIALNPDIKLMGSPWSAPAWMKTNGSPKSGSLRPEYFRVYANYFVRYVIAMKQHGIMVDAITLQNEPENPHNTPSMLMTAQEQTAFVRDYLGPAFRDNGLTTRVVIFDHNCDHPDYPISILNDSAARKFVDGSAFHLYAGEASAMSQVHAAHPDKNIYFTEQWTSAEGEFGGDLQWHARHVLIGATHNWARAVLEWNLANDEAFDPHTDDGGCTSCLGALTIGDSITRNVSYYVIAHASRFVPPGSVRVNSVSAEEIPHVAFLLPDKSVVMVVQNERAEPRQISIRLSRDINLLLPPRSLSTVVLSR
ncbi:MAG: glycoside hydrolase family 30 protein [Cyclobacteriaceae bacterium]|jgi:glucosylceramidase